MIAILTVSHGTSDPLGQQAVAAFAEAVHDAVDALEPERILLLPDGVEDLWGQDYRDLIALA